MRKIAISAALIAAVLFSPLSASAAEYICADGTTLSTGTQVEYSYVREGVLTTATRELEARTPLIIWEKSECRLRTAKGLPEAFDYAEKVSAYVSQWGIFTLEELFPERFGK